MRSTRRVTVTDPLPVKLPRIYDLASIKHDVPFDPTYGFTLPDLYAGRGGAMLEGRAEPRDFEPFWQDTYAEQAAIAPKILETRPSEQEKLAPGYRVEEVYFDVLDGWRVGGWLCVPRDRAPERLVVAGHGYGGREAIALDPLDGRQAVLFICAPGFHLSTDSKRVVSNNAGFHVINGIEDPRRYIIRACVAAYWAGGRILQSQFPQVPMIYDGTSFGGGLGAIVLAWGEIFRGGWVGQPTFANHPFRLQQETRGSASAVRALWLRASAEEKARIEHTLDYYETVFHARRIRVPVAFCLSVFDPAVPAAGQFSVALSVPRRLRRIVPTTTGHYDYRHPLEPLEARRMRAARKWLWQQVEGQASSAG